MKSILLIGFLFCSTLYASGQSYDKGFIFFLHNRFLEEHGLDESHPEFGRTEYKGIVEEFKKPVLKPYRKLIIVVIF
ncbi:hypothetical protein [Salegentibacter sp. Hel_I_6]|uniref:hypothetical protein n=1 Tax=Salegentibacter sp. Hel_I_6 TaxID=1250278 RepID=UPI00350F48EF